MGPAGSINSSVTEMSNWVITWINGGNYKGKEIIPSSHVREAMSSQVISAPGLPEKETPDIHFANYGFGWALTSYRGHYRVDHGGNIDGFSASTAFYPTDSFGIIVLSNQDRSVIPTVVRNLIADRILNLPFIDWSANRKKTFERNKAAQAEQRKTAYSNRKTGTRPSHPINDYTGLFEHPGYGRAEVQLLRDSLFVRVPDKTLWLRHYHYDVFEAFEKDPVEGIDTLAGSPMKFQFNTDINGDISSLFAGLEASLKPIEFVRKPKEVLMSAENLQKYVGDYDLNGTPIKVYTKGNVLYVFIPGQPDYELAAAGNDKFHIKSLNGYSLQFAPDEKKGIKEVSFLQPNGIFKATKKL
jgi:hypothetical protein